MQGMGASAAGCSSKALIAGAILKNDPKDLFDFLVGSPPVVGY